MDRKLAEHLVVVAQSLLVELGKLDHLVGLTHDEQSRKMLKPILGNLIGLVMFDLIELVTKEHGDLHPFKASSEECHCQSGLGEDSGKDN